MKNSNKRILTLAVSVAVALAGSGFLVGCNASGSQELDSVLDQMTQQDYLTDSAKEYAGNYAVNYQYWDKSSKLWVGRDSQVVDSVCWTRGYPVNGADCKVYTPVADVYLDLSIDAETGWIQVVDGGIQADCDGAEECKELYPSMAQEYRYINPVGEIQYLQVENIDKY